MTKVSLQVTLQGKETIVGKVPEIKRLIIEQIDFDSLRELSDFGEFDGNSLTIDFEATLLKTKEYERLLG